MAQITEITVNSDAKFNNLKEKIDEEFSKALENCSNKEKNEWRIFYRGESKDYNEKRVRLVRGTIDYDKHILQK